jgi:hypothetical protein
MQQHVYTKAFSIVLLWIFNRKRNKGTKDCIYLFICAVCITDYITSTDDEINNEVERTWKEAVVAEYKILL